MFNIVRGLTQLEGIYIIIRRKKEHFTPICTLKSDINRAFRLLTDYRIILRAFPGRNASADTKFHVCISVLYVIYAYASRTFTKHHCLTVAEGGYQFPSILERKLYFPSTFIVEAYNPFCSFILWNKIFNINFVYFQIWIHLSMKHSGDILKQFR